MRRGHDNGSRRTARYLVVTRWAGSFSNPCVDIP